MYYMQGPQLSTRNVEINQTGPDPCPHNQDMKITILPGKHNKVQR